MHNGQSTRLSRSSVEELSGVRFSCSVSLNCEVADRQVSASVAFGRTQVLGGVPVLLLKALKREDHAILQTVAKLVRTIGVPIVHRNRDAILHNRRLDGLELVKLFLKIDLDVNGLVGVDRELVARAKAFLFGQPRAGPH